MPNVDKNNPPPQWIQTLRKRFPCEDEFDRVLTRKLQLRNGPNFSAGSLQSLLEGTEALLRANIDNDFSIGAARWMLGGASKLQVAFDLEWQPEGEERCTTAMVLRMQPAESISETSRLREFQVINALKGHLPVPGAYWVDAEATFLPQPTIIYTLAQGVTKPTSSSSSTSGIATYLPPHMREPLGSQFVEHLARLHNFDWSAADLGAFNKPTPGPQAVELQLNHWERVWEEDANEDIRLMRITMSWLRRNIPPVDKISLIHGDDRVGNFLFMEESLEISAWLDWELAYLGDRHGDLSWSMKSIFGHLDEDQHTFLVGGFMPRKDFISRYEQASGLPINPETLKFYDVLNLYKCIAISLGTGSRVAFNGKTHQDVLVGWIAGVGYPLLEDLRIQLREVL